MNVWDGVCCTFCRSVPFFGRTFYEIWQSELDRRNELSGFGIKLNFMTVDRAVAGFAAVLNSSAACFSWSQRSDGSGFRAIYMRPHRKPFERIPFLLLVFDGSVWYFRLNRIRGNGITETNAITLADICWSGTAYRILPRTAKEHWEGHPITWELQVNLLHRHHEKSMHKFSVRCARCFRWIVWCVHASETVTM